MAEFKKNQKISGKKTNKKPEKKVKVNYVEKRIPLGHSNFYSDNITELYNLLDKITFNLIPIPVTMAKSVAFGNKELDGHITVGNITKFNGNEFVITMAESFAEKITDESVVIVNCKKNYDNGEFTYVNGIYIARGKPIVSDDDLKEFEMPSEETSAELTEDSE